MRFVSQLAATISKPGAPSMCASATLAFRVPGAVLNTPFVALLLSPSRTSAPLACQAYTPSSPTTISGPPSPSRSPTATLLAVGADKASGNPGKGAAVVFTASTGDVALHCRDESTSTMAY